MKLTCDRSRVEPLYLFYFFRSTQGRHELLKNASTVGTPGIGQPLSTLKSIKVPLRLFSEQKAIAQALFQSWFVDFGTCPRKTRRAQTYCPAWMTPLLLSSRITFKTHHSAIFRRSGRQAASVISRRTQGEVFTRTTLLRTRPTSPWNTCPSLHCFG